MNKEPDRNPRKALGKGLSALLPARGSAAAAAQAAIQPQTPSTTSQLPDNFEAFEGLPLDQISPGGEQPRLNFAEDKLNELADSIRANGVIQPITVRQDAPGKYRIIAGERRWRAAQIAGLTVIPALIRTADDHQRLELALIENLQREDLNPMEIANAFQRLIDEHKLSHEQIAQRTGKDRSTVTNFLRLHKASPYVQSCLINGSITMGHARALLNLEGAQAQDLLCKTIIDSGLSVRSAEQLVRLTQNPPAKVPKPQLEEPESEDPNIRAALQELEAALGTRVRLVRRSNGSGKLEVEFYSADDLDRIYSTIVRN